MEDKQLSLDLARTMIEAARKFGFLSSQLPVAPELAASEKNLLVLLSGKISEYVSLRGEAALEQDELQSLFTYVYARSAEAVSAWLSGNPFLPGIEGMFNGNTPFQAEEKLIAVLKARHLADCMYGVFIDWNEKHADCCREYGVHPVLPLLEALKWTFRFGAGIAVEFFEEQQRLRQEESAGDDRDSRG